MFGIATHLYLGDRLERDHLVEIAAHGFEAVEVFAVRDHFDYHDRRAALALAEWLDDTRLTLHSLHAPVGYDGAWIFELAAAAERRPVIERAVKAREQFESLLNIGDEPPIGSAAD